MNAAWILVKIVKDTGKFTNFGVKNARVSFKNVENIEGREINRKSEREREPKREGWEIFSIRCKTNILHISMSSCMHFVAV